jgi:hypothetical protein
MSAVKHLHHIADNHQRGALMGRAIDKGMEQARGDFFYALLVEGLDDQGLSMVAGEAWKAYSRHVEFDYPRFAQTLFLRGFKLGYRTHLRNVADGRHESAHELVAVLEADMGLSSM